MLVYEILNLNGARLIFVENENIAREICLIHKDYSCRPIFVAEDFGSAKIELRNCE